MINLSGFINIRTIESKLEESYRKSRHDKKLHLDLRKVEWISPLSLSVIYSWAFEIASAGGHVMVNPPETDSFAAAFFSSADVLARFETAHLRTEGKMPMSRFAIGKIAAFEIFPHRNSFEAYVANLRDTATRSKLLHSENSPEFVSSGHFHSVAVNELVDNTFVHANGKNSHYVAFEADPTAAGSREPHPIFAGFGGEGYIEICVGDSSERNLVDTLRPFLPKDYQPLGTIDQPRKLDKTELCILDAFEYGSTSQPEARAKKLAEWLEEPDKAVQGIATGLYDILTLARFYQGQVIVRTAGRLGTLDFSNAAVGWPRIAFWRNLGGAALAKLKGTIISLRVPVKRVGAERGVFPKPRQKKTATSVDQLPIVIKSPLPNGESLSSVTDRLVSLEQETKEALRLSASKPGIVAVVLDGLGLASKSLGAFLDLLLCIPRYRSALAVTTNDSRHLVVAREQWERKRSAATAREDFLRWPGFIVAVEGEAGACVYGSSDHVESTTLSDNHLSLPSGPLVPLEDMLEHIRMLRLKEALSSYPICHEYKDRLFLIEGAYYTKKFYEVRALLTDNCTRETLVLWLRSKLAKLKPAAVIYNVAFLEPVLKAALYHPTEPEGRPQLLQVRSDNVLPLAIEAKQAAGETGQVVIVLDVLCKGRFLMKFLNVFPDVERTSVITLVDARDSDMSYIPVLRSHSIDVRVDCVLKERLKPINDRPTSLSAQDIIAVDRLTHGPTHYPVPQKTSLNETVLLKRANETGSLAGGHYVLHDKHYQYFLPFKEIFAELRTELEAWLRSEFRELIVNLSVERENVQTFCLDEETGLFQSVERVLRNDGLQGPVPLTRAKLFAPPAVHPKAETRGTSWFVLPAMASGKTIQRCFEYGKALDVIRMHVSVVTARVEPEMLLFFQRITEYHGVKVLVHFMFSLPLLAYPEAQCPACSLLKLLRMTAAEVGQKRPHLRKLLNTDIVELEPVPVQSAGWLERPLKQQPALWRESSARADYERASRDFTARTLLMNRLSKMEWAEALAGAIGRGPADSAFAEDRLKPILYSPARLIKSCHEWSSQRHTDPETFSRQLRGFARMAPDVLHELLPELFRRYRSDSQFYARLLIEAAHQSEFYWEAIETSPPPDDEELKEALIELRDFVRRGGGGVDSAGIRALHELRWQLVRSNGWGMPLEMIRMKSRLAGVSRELLLGAFQRFIVEGDNGARRRLFLARTTGTIWDRLTGPGKQLEKLWAEVEDKVRKLQDAIEAFEGDTEGVRRTISNLEQARDDFLIVLDRIALRPGSAMETIRERSKLSNRTATEFTVNVKPDCPSIAITELDFEELILLLLENARDMISNGEANATFFEFAGMGPGVPSALLSVSQSLPWKLPEVLEGGLARIREILVHCGASMQLDRSASAGAPFLKIRFLAWPMDQTIA